MKSIYEMCPKCKSLDREFIGTEANYGLDDAALWDCKGCGITYDGPIPPYSDDPVFVAIDELVKL